MLLVSVADMSGQNNTYSPYSRYGLGEFINPGYGPSRALGGVGIGTRFTNQINYLNPANYTSQDTLSFLFDVGLFGNSSRYRTTNTSIQNSLINLDHLAMSFPISKWWYSSFGLMPYTGVGYDVLEIRPITGSEYLQRTQYSGNGGLNKFYFGNAIRIGNHLSIGANASYLFGMLEYNSIQTILTPDSTTKANSYPSELSETIDIRDFVFDFGVQVFGTIAEKHSLVFGATYEPSSDIRVFQTFEKSTTIPFGYGKDTLEYFEDLKKQITHPEKIGLGFSYHFDRKLLIAFDYQQRNWSKYQFLDRQQQLKDSKSYKVGIQLTPNPQTLRRGTLKSYLNRSDFRLGGHYDETYIQFDDVNIKNYAVSVGLGLPLANNKTRINLSYELGVKGTTDNGLIEQQYGIFSIGLSLYDRWFYQAKIE